MYLYSKYIIISFLFDCNNVMASISVFVRVRPMLQSEIDSNQQAEKRFAIAPNRKEISVEISEKREKIFNFNKVFNGVTTQEQLYNGLQISSLVTKVLDGYHSTIFAYGQTGSGKTFTIEGQQNNPGLISRALDQMFYQLQQRNNNDRVFKVMLSFVQIYNEGIYDLIDATGKPLRMRWNKHQQFIVQNLFEVQCRNRQDAIKWWKKGQKNKIMGSHKMNINSSRSHCLFTLKVSSYDLQDPSNLIESKFEIVDLAGSQRQKVTKSTGAIFREGIQINKSLFTLRQVISSLYEISQGENSNKHIPYRDSKLTSLLKQSIGGNTYCSMIACLNPTSTHFQESLQTLTYASMAAFINNVPSKNVDPKVRENQQLRDQNQQYRKQIKKMAEHIEQLTRLLEAGICSSCKGNENRVNILRRTQTQINTLKQKEEDEVIQPSGILKLPRFLNRGGTVDATEKSIENINKTKMEQKQKTIFPTTQKKTLKTNKDILESITMIKQLINANSGLRQKIQYLRSISEKQEKQIYNLMKQNQVLRDRWDMMSDAITPNENEREYDQAPIAIYERLIQEERGNSGASFYKPARLVSQNSNTLKGGTKPTSYNQFLKMSVKQEDSKSRKRKNLSMYHRQTGRSEHLV